MDMGIISELNFLSFKANTKTGILIVTFGNVKVTAKDDVMLNGCLKTAGNPAISVNLLLLLIQEVS